MWKYKFIGILMFCRIFTNAKYFSAAIAREKLISDLFVNYNPAVRPVLQLERTDIEVNIELQHFDFRESDGAFNIVGFMNAKWCDKKLKWNPKDYNNITQIPVNQKLVWIPDLEMYYNAPDRFLRMHRNGYVVLNNTGNITWSDAIEMTIFCTTNMRDWPKDKHSCHLKLGSWIYDGFDIDITYDPITSLSFDEAHIKNMQYELINYTVEHERMKYLAVDEPFVSMNYYIEIKRRSGYSNIFYAPIYTVIILTILSLAMKSDRSEKILLNGINLFVITFQLLYFAGNIGKFARGTPLIVIFYSWSFVIVTFSHLLCVFALWASHSKFNNKRVPVYISNFLNGPIVAYILPVKQTMFSRAQETENSQFEDVKLNDCSNLIPTGNNSNEWLKFALFLERIAIIVFGLLYLILATICLI